MEYPVYGNVVCNAEGRTQDQGAAAHRQAKVAAAGAAGPLIRRLHQLHCALFLKETRDFAITPVQYSLMTTLGERGEIDQNSLALAIGLERTSVAETAGGMQQ